MLDVWSFELNHIGSFRDETVHLLSLEVLNGLSKVGPLVGQLPHGSIIVSTTSSGQATGNWNYSTGFCSILAVTPLSSDNLSLTFGIPHLSYPIHGNPRTAQLLYCLHSHNLLLQQQKLYLLMSQSHRPWQ